MEGSRRRWIAASIALLALDLATLALPVTACLLLYVAVRRPEWFRRAVEELYARGACG